MFSQKIDFITASGHRINVVIEPSGVVTITGAPKVRARFSYSTVFPSESTVLRSYNDCFDFMVLARGVNGFPQMTMTDWGKHIFPAVYPTVLLEKEDTKFRILARNGINQFSKEFPLL